MSSSNFKVVVAAKSAVPGIQQLQDITLSDSAAVMIDEVLERAEQLETIDNESDLELFREVQCSLDDVLGSLEASRRILTAPFASAVKLINSKTKTFSAALFLHSTRLKAALGAFYGEKRRAELEERKRLEDMVTAASLAAMRSDDPATREEMQQLAGQAQHAAAEAVKPNEGVTVRLGWDSELCLGGGPIVARTNPQLLRFELNKIAVNAMIKSLEDDGTEIGEYTIPGIRLTPRTSLSIRR